MHADDARNRVARETVWMALSLLYLDTDTANEHADVANILAASPYTLPQLRAMLFEDVHPALRANLWSVAGVWLGFDPPWLIASIERRRARPRWLRGLSCVFCRDPAAHWQALRSLIVATRAGNEPMPVARCA